VAPDTSALQTNIAICNATVPVLKDTWFAAEADKVVTLNNYMATCTAANDWSSDIVNNTNGFDSAAQNIVTSTRNSWIVGINACIQNKQQLFDVLQNEASAQSLAAAYNAKLDILKSAIDLMYINRLNVDNKYIAGVMSAHAFGDWFQVGNGLASESSDAQNRLIPYLDEWDSTYAMAESANSGILNRLISSAAVTRISNLCDLKISTYESNKTSETDYYTAIHTKYLATAGITDVDLIFKNSTLAGMDNDAIRYKNDALTKYTTALTDKPTIVAAANAVLNA